MRELNFHLDGLDIPVFQLDSAGQLIRSTPIVEKWTGLKQGGVLSSVFSAADRKRFEKSLQRVLEGKTKRAALELTLSPLKGELVPVEIVLSPIPENNEVAAVSGWLRDLRTEHELRTVVNEQNVYLLQLLENTPDALVMENAAGEVKLVNAVFCDWFGIKAAPQSLIDMPCKELFDMAMHATEKNVAPAYSTTTGDNTTGDNTPSDNKTSPANFALKDGRALLHLTLPAGSESGMAGRLHLFRMSGNNPLNVQPNVQPPQATTTPCAAATATTATTAIQSIESIARDLAITVEEAGSAVHHAEQFDLPAALIDHFHRVETSARSAFFSIAGLLDFSQMEGHALPLDCAEFQLRESVGFMLERVAAYAEARGIQLHLRVEQDVPNNLTGDRPRLMLALRHLLESGPAAQQTTLTIAPEYTAGELVHLSFTIDHHGLDSISTTPAPATTIQIARARQIVHSMAGQLDIRQRKESVTYQFTVAFPWKNTPVAAPKPAFVTLTGMPVLVVSNDITQRETLSALARSWRMHPREADNASMALQLLLRLQQEEAAIPLVITSSKLPIQDGFLLAFRIKHHPRLAQTSVILLTANSRPGDAMVCRENGISAYLRQPVDPQQLNEAIVAVMGLEDDASATQTLITRHSLRERSAGNTLLIDANRKQTPVATKALRRKNFRVTLAESAQEAFDALTQDIFDLIIVDANTPGFHADQPLPQQIRRHIRKDAATLPILLATDIHNELPKEFSGIINKPYEKHTLVAQVSTFAPEKARSLN